MTRVRLHRLVVVVDPELRFAAVCTTMGKLAQNSNYRGM